MERCEEPGALAMKRNRNAFFIPRVVLCGVLWSAGVFLSVVALNKSIAKTPAGNGNNPTAIGAHCNFAVRRRLLVGGAHNNAVFAPSQKNSETITPASSVMTLARAAAVPTPRSTPTPRSPLTPTPTPTERPGGSEDLQYSFPIDTDNISVSRTGALTMALNVPLPPAYLQPEINATYNSQGGDGCMGMGWCTQYRRSR